MQSEEEGGRIVARLDDGEDLHAALLAVAERHRLASGLVHWGIGMVREFELGYFEGREYLHKSYFRPSEMLSLHGTITPGSDPPLHLHLAAAHSDFSVVGGHLFKGIVNVVNEVSLERLDAIKLERLEDARYKLRLLCVLPPIPR